LRACLAVAGLTLALASPPASAHHSAAMFDGDKLVVVRGELVSFTNMNPHAWISILGKVDGREMAERWDVEATSPAMLAREGIGSENLKPRDRLTIALRPLRDGRRGGGLVFVVTADGVPHGADPKAVGLDVAALKP